MHLMILMNLRVMISKKLVVVLGPTAIGKTSLSINLAKHYNTEIVSADSRQFYKELLIGSAPPSKDELKEVKHHFIQHISVSEDYNVGNFEEDAIKKIEELFHKKDKVILVGGSGLYIDAVCKGFDNMPEISSEMRKNVINIYNEKGIEFLQSEVKSKDPIYYSEVDKKNPQRLMRALEIIYSTNKTYSSYKTKIPKKRNFNIVKVGLQIQRDILYDRINNRVEKMISNGLLKEVESLINYRHKNSLQTVGYKELFDYLEGGITFSNAISKIKQNTRRYAKRQITWFKKDKKTTYFSPQNIKGIVDFIEL